MSAVLGFLIASAIGCGVLLIAGRRGAVYREDYPWLLDEVYKLHVNIVGTLAGFAFTGVVLVVTLARDRLGGSQASLDTVIVMFLVAYLWWVGAAFLISYLPHHRTSGDLAQRVHFSLASTIEYRTVFLSWFALLPLLQANGLGRLSHVLYFLLPVSLVLGSTLVSMAIDGLGILKISEIYLSAAIATALALVYGGVVAWVLPGLHSVYSALNLAIVIFCVNGAGFVLAGLTPLSPRYPNLRHFFERYARLIVIADMQLTMVSLAFLWLAVVGTI